MTMETRIDVKIVSRMWPVFALLLAAASASSQERRRGAPTQLVVYPGQSHGIRVPSYQVDRYQRYLSWYDKWVKGTSKPVTEEGI